MIRQIRRIRLIRLPCYLLPLLIASTAACAQAPSTSQAPANPVPVFKSSANAVVVDVVVTKGQDEPVQSLHKQDFQVFEDGKPQSIDFFEEHTALPDPQINLVKMPPNVFTNVPEAPLTDSVNVLLLDSLNTPRQDQSFMRDQLLKYLKNKKPSARIAIFTLGSRLNLIQGFTGDSGLLQAALKDKHFGFSPVTAEPSRSRSDDDADKEEVAIKAEAFGGARGMGTAGVAALQQSQAQYSEYQGDQRVAMTLDALQHLGRFLAGIPGRKNLIWFASSYPIYFFPNSTEKQPLNNHGEYAKQIKATSDLLTLSKVAVYPIDAEGMMNDHPMDSEHDLGAAGMGGALLTNTMNGAAARSDTISTMRQLAADTGGQAILNSNDLGAALDRVIHNGDHYYTLVYTPANKQMDGNFRNIQIKLGENKYQLSYRRGYYADDSSAPANSKPQKTLVSASVSNQEPAQHADPLTPLLTRGMPASTQVLYAVRVQPAEPQPAPTAKHLGANTKLTGAFTRYTADFLIDPKKIQLELTPEGNRTGKIQVGLLAWDHDGKALNWVGGTMVLNLNPTTYLEIQKTGIRAHAELDIPQTNVYLSTGVYDLNANKAGTLEIPLAPTAPAAALASPSGK